jgi:hypothetical protein
LQGEEAAKRERKEEDKRERRRRQALRLVVTNCWVRNSAFSTFFVKPVSPPLWKWLFFPLY